MNVNGATVDGEVSLVVYGPPQSDAWLGFLTKSDAVPFSGAGFKFVSASLPSAGIYTLRDALSGTGATWGIYTRDEYSWDPFGTPGTLEVTLTEVAAGVVHGSARFEERHTLDATF